MELTGTIFNMQRYSIHDGPGIRTVVFLKGCPLSCKWCSNPESQKREPQLFYVRAKCIKCGVCRDACEKQAITVYESGIEIDKSRCVECHTCTQYCPTEALYCSGELTTVEQLIKKVSADRPFMEQSNGGVTFSGGEPLVQHAFLKEAVGQLKELGYHIAVETTGFCETSCLVETTRQIDLILYDLKHIDDQKHQKLTGVSNQIILKNARKIYDPNKVVFRLPIIPGFNDEQEDLANMAKFISSIDPGAKAELLPYHSLGKSKYHSIGREYELSDTQPPEEQEMEQVLKIFLDQGLPAKIV